jgi:hypothetical protein
MNKIGISGDIWYDTTSSELKIFDGAVWITIQKMKPTKNDIENYCDWRRKFALLPHRCAITNRIIWLEHAWCAEPSWTVIGDSELRKIKPIWHCEQEHLIWLMQNA